MSHFEKKLWRGLREEAINALELRDYSPDTPSVFSVTKSIEACQMLIMRDAGATGWIPGVEIFKRKVYSQYHRGYFGELGREGEGRLGEIGFWPKQWASATMFAGSAKGFHIHPPHIPEKMEAETWFRKLFTEEAKRYEQRPYDMEQWDVMFFLTGRVEVFLIDERAGMPRNRLRFYIDGDNHRGANNMAIVIPPGVAHALRTEGSENTTMVYGTSTVFNPQNEGRFFSGIETALLPVDWEKYWESV